MNKFIKFEYKILARIVRKKTGVFLRKDFADLGGYDQVGRALKDLSRQGKIIKIGYGLYAKTEISQLTGEIIPQKNLPQLANEALERLGVKTAPSSVDRDYNTGRSTQVPTGRLIAIKGRIVSRKIGYGGIYVSFEPITG